MAPFYYQERGYMAKIIKNMGEFAEVYATEVKEVLKLVAIDVKKEIDNAIDRYYSEYDPSMRRFYTNLFFM